MYATIPRPDTATTFPKHVFLRGQNLHTNIYDRIGNRENCFKSTLIHMTERWGGREVFLVGTMNQSTMLAQRTKKLIEELKPDTVIVQANDEWWNQAKLLKYVDSQEEMENYSKQLSKALALRDFDYYFASRRWLFLTRLAIYS